MRSQPVQNLLVQLLGPGRAACGLCLAAAVLLNERIADAQEALRSSMAGDAAAGFRKIWAKSVGFFLCLLSNPSLLCHK